MSIEAKAQLVGVPFNRNLQVDRGEESVFFTAQRLVRIIMALNIDTGYFEFHAAHDVHYPVETLPHIPFPQDGTLFDNAWVRRSLETARKDGASSPFVDTNKTFTVRGGSLQSLIKESGFMLEESKATMVEVRSQKRVTTRYGEEVAAIIQGGKSRPRKTTGFGSPENVKGLKKDANRKKYRARILKKQMSESYVEFP